MSCGPDESLSFSAPKDQASCVSEFTAELASAKVPAGCPLTLGDFEDCLVSQYDDPCATEVSAACAKENDPACASPAPDGGTTETGN